MVLSLFKSYGGKQLFDPVRSHHIQGPGHLISWQMDPDLLVAQSEFKPQASATVPAEGAGGVWLTGVYVRWLRR